MKEQTPIRMADLLPLAPPPDQSLWPWAAITGLILLSGVVLWWWRRTRDPFHRLLDCLHGGTLTPREVAHRLTKQSDLTQTQQAQLDQLRFAKPAPDKQQIEQLLRNIRDAR